MTTAGRIEPRPGLSERVRAGPAGSVPLHRHGATYNRRMTPILDFFHGRARDHRGRSLDDLQDQGEDALERTHDYIQWLFPLPERSRFNPDAPTLTTDDIATFRGDDSLRMELNTSFRTMMRFYGLHGISSEHGSLVRESPAFMRRGGVWLTPNNHNYLRLTRILRSMTLLGCTAEADALLTCLERLYRTHHAVIGEETLRFWRDAVKADA